MSSNNTDPKTPTISFYTHEEMEAALAMLTMRNPVIFSDNNVENKGTAGPQSGRRGAIASDSSAPEVDVPVPAEEADKKASKKISLAEYMAMKKVRADKEEAEKK